MIRFIAIIFLMSLIGFSCVKPKTKNSTPAIEYMNTSSFGRTSFANQAPRDTGVLVLSYEDGDGDIFVDNTSQGPNLFFIPFFYNSATNKFDADIDPFTNDTFMITSTLRQPGDGYKGKSIKGEIYVPLTEYRLNEQRKIIKFTGFVTDLKGNKSNIVTSPVYTLTF